MSLHDKVRVVCNKSDVSFIRIIAIISTVVQLLLIYLKLNGNLQYNWVIILVPVLFTITLCLTIFISVFMVIALVDIFCGFSESDLD